MFWAKKKKVLYGHDISCSSSQTTCTERLYDKLCMSGNSGNFQFLNYVNLFFQEFGLFGKDDRKTFRGDTIQK